MKFDLNPNDIAVDIAVPLQNDGYRNDIAVNIAVDIAVPLQNDRCRNYIAVEVVYYPLYNDQIQNDIAIVDVDDKVAVDDDVVDVVVVVVVDVDVAVAYLGNNLENKDVVHLNFVLQEIRYIVVPFCYNNKLNCKYENKNSKIAKFYILIRLTLKNKNFFVNIFSIS